MSEKAYALSEERRTFVFDVPSNATKQAIAGAVASQYQVSVTSVRIASTASKSHRIVKRRGQNSYSGQSAGVRKAYVRVAEGESIPIFAAVKEEEEKEAKLAEKAAKKAEKAEKSPATEVKETKTTDSKAPAKPAKPESRGRRFGFMHRGNR